MAGLFKRILSKFSREKFDWDELEETLISGDLGVQLSMQIIDSLQEKRKSINPEDIIEACRNEIRSILPTDSVEISPVSA